MQLFLPVATVQTELGNYSWVQEFLDNRLNGLDELALANTTRLVLSLAVPGLQKLGDCLDVIFVPVGVPKVVKVKHQHALVRLTLHSGTHPVHVEGHVSNQVFDGNILEENISEQHEHNWSSAFIDVTRLHKELQVNELHEFFLV